MKKYILWGLLMGVGLTACNNEEVTVNDSQIKMELNVTAGDIQGRGIVNTATLPGNSSIGVMLREPDKTTYDGLDYVNVKATADNAVPQTWTLAKDVFLSATMGEVTAYYPYNSPVADYTAIPVTAGETDYMYATKVENVYNGSPKVLLNMNHALAAIRFTVKRGTYTGVGLLSAVGVQGTAAAKRATMNAWTGQLASFTGGGEKIEIASNVTLTADEQNVDAIVVPSGEKSTLVLTLVVDGRTYTVNTGELTLLKGQIYKYVVTLDSEKAVLSSLAVSDWGYNDIGASTVK